MIHSQSAEPSPGRWPAPAIASIEPPDRPTLTLLCLLASLYFKEVRSGREPSTLVAILRCIAETVDASAAVMRSPHRSEWRRARESIAAAISRIDAGPAEGSADLLHAVDDLIACIALTGAADPGGPVREPRQ